MVASILPIQLLEPTLDRILATYVNGVSASFSAALGVVVAAAIALQFTLLGLQIVRGEVQDPINKIAGDSLGMVIMAAIALSAGIYQEQIVVLVSGVIEFLVSVASNGSAKSVGEAVERIFTTDGGSVVVDGKQIAVNDALWVIALQNPIVLGIPDPTYVIASAFIWLGTALISALCLLPWLLSKVAISIALAVGPLFITLGIWPVTRNYFTSWLSFLVGNIFTGMLVALVCSLAPTAFKEIIVQSLANVGSADFNPIQTSLALLVVAIGLAFVALQLSQMGSQLAGGGIALDSKGVAGALVNRIMQRGSPQAGGTPSDGNSVKPSFPLNRAREFVGRQAGKRVSQVLDAVRSRGASK